MREGACRAIRRIPHTGLRRRPRSPSYVYGFAWPSNRPGVGACHALELGFVFDGGDEPDARGLAGEGAPRALSDAVHGVWARFVSDGEPGWERWDASHPVRVFDEAPPATVYGPRDRELALWTTPPPPPLRNSARSSAACAAVVCSDGTEGAGSRRTGLRSTCLPVTALRPRLRSCTRPVLPRWHHEGMRGLTSRTACRGGAENHA
ncbi:hypothetical protein ACVW19_005475 [Streptomyces sp. TE5632]